MHTNSIQTGTNLSTGVVDGQTQTREVPQGLFGVSLEQHGQGIDDDLEHVLVWVPHTLLGYRKKITGTQQRR